MSAPPSDTRFSFSRFVFSEATLELTREGRLVPLEPQPARVLGALLARAGDVVTRDELRRLLWGDTHVDYDRGLAYCVGQVRAALGDHADTPRFIQTLPRRGFRFIAPVASDGPAPAAARPAADPPETDGRRFRPQPPQTAPRWLWLSAAAVVMVALVVTSALRRPAPIVAVSVFDNETGDPGYDAFVSGLSDLVVTRLTAVAPGRLGVVGNLAPLRQPRNIRNLEQLARTLPADFIVLGQLQRQDDRLRFIVHLIRLTDGVHVSAQRLVRPPGEAPTFEPAVVAETERAVRAHVLGEGGA